MCVLNACCCCIFLDVGCVLIAILLSAVRILLLYFISQKHPEYNDLSHLTELHGTILILIIGSIIPIFLIFGYCFLSHRCVCAFVLLEILFLVASLAWDGYYNFYTEEGKQWRKHYEKEYYFWLPYLIWLVLELYFLWVAISYYVFLQNIYYDSDHYTRQSESNARQYV